MCLLTYKNKEMKCNFIRPCAAMLRAYVIMELVPFLLVSFKKNKRKRWRDRLCIDTRAKETGGQCVDGRTCGVSCEQNSEKPFNPCVCVCVDSLELRMRLTDDGEILFPRP